MSYQPLIPTGTVKLSVDYANIQGNFQSLDTIFNVDHVPYSNTTPQKGFHKCVHLNAVSTVAVPLPLPVPVPLTGEIFSAQVNDGINTDEQLFFQSGDNGFLTNLTRNFQPLPIATGATFLPGGLILNWGKITLNKNPNLTTVTFTQPYLNPASVFSITLSKISADNSTTGQEVRIVTGSVTATQFEVSQSSSSSANELYWMALGV